MEKMETTKKMETGATLTLVFDKLINKVYTLGEVAEETNQILQKLKNPTEIPVAKEEKTMPEINITGLNLPCAFASVISILEANMLMIRSDLTSIASIIGE